MHLRSICTALLGAAAIAGGSASPAGATHNGDCPRFDKPGCNVKYVREHQVDPVVDPVVEDVETAVAGLEEAVFGVLCDVFGACS